MYSTLSVIILKYIFIINLFKYQYIHYSELFKFIICFQNMTNKTQRRDSPSNSYDFDPFNQLFHLVFRVLILIVIAAAVFAAILAVISFPFNYSRNIFWNAFDALLGVFFILWIISWFLPGKYRYRRLHYRWYNYQNSEEILKVRYAKGEISKKEFEEKLKELMKYR